MTNETAEREPIMSFRKKDFRVQWFNCSGAGGQHKNKHANACRITHIETGLTAIGQNYRERPANQKAAFNRLAEMVIDHYGLRDRPKPPTSDERIRTYHAERNEVKNSSGSILKTYKDIVIENDYKDVEELIIERKHIQTGDDKD